jgi:hypothetical protein
VDPLLVNGPLETGLALLECRHVGIRQGLGPARLCTRQGKPVPEHSVRQRIVHGESCCAPMVDDNVHYVVMGHRRRPFLHLPARKTSSIQMDQVPMDLTGSLVSASNDDDGRPTTPFTMILPASAHSGSNVSCWCRRLARGF